jgi:uncharacterized protein with HEPN domain
MSKHDTEISLRQMLTYAREAVQLCKDKHRQSLDSDRLLNLALVRLLEITGEAANRVPDEIQEANPNIPWMQIIGLRNRLIHGYDDVDFDILWEIVTIDLPKLIIELELIN